MSTATAGSGDGENRNGEQKQNLWTSMLESVASGKRLPEKNLIVLGTNEAVSFFCRDTSVLICPDSRRVSGDAAGLLAVVGELRS